MTLLEMSAFYKASATNIRLRMTELRVQARRTQDREKVRALRRRITELMPLLQEAKELAELTAHYYEKGYYKNAKYTL